MDEIDKMLDELTGAVYILVWYRGNEILRTSERMTAADAFVKWDAQYISNLEEGVHIAHYKTPMECARHVYVEQGQYQIGYDGRAFKRCG